jgi:uncharacterized membrane protein YhiD involved in acid resistance
VEVGKSACVEKCGGHVEMVVLEGEEERRYTGLWTCVCVCVSACV